ncbi:MAG: RNA methyltransferase [Desertifilum sp.]|nr:RNA methyltransferase [Desertifilum sp.]
MQITSAQNPLVKQIRKLHQAKGRREQQLFLLEGTHLIEEACSAGYPLVTACCTPEWLEKHQALWQQVEQRCDRAWVVSEAVMKAIATTVTPDGVIATAPRRQPFSIAELLQSPIPLILVLETLQDPGNLGTIIRTAAASGISGLVISTDSVDLDHPKVLRASAGQWFRLPVIQCENLQQALEELRACGVQLVATTPQATLTHWDLNWQQPTAILLGNEGAGLSPELLAIADTPVKIPLHQGVESLNVAIAAAVILYEAQRQRR